MFGRRFRPAKRFSIAPSRVAVRLILSPTGGVPWLRRPEQSAARIAGVQDPGRNRADYRDRSGGAQRRSAPRPGLFWTDI